MTWLGIAVCVYAVLMGLGGLIGFIKGRSMPSLMAGVGSCVLLLILAFESVHHPRVGFAGATLIAFVLEFLFVRRYLATRKPMPSLGLAALSGVMLILLIVGHFMAR